MPGALKYLGSKHCIEVENATVVTTREVQRHIANKHSSTAKLTEADLDRLPEIIARPRAVLYDLHGKEKPILLYVFDPAEAKARTRLDKVVVRVNFKVKTKFEGNTGEAEKPRGARIIANVVRTAGYVDTNNLKEARYDLLVGKLE